MHGLNAGNYPACSRGDDTSGFSWPRTLASSATKRAKGDPFPTFLHFFYNNEVGKEATEARAGSLAPLFRARSRSGPKILRRAISLGMIQSSLRDLFFIHIPRNKFLDYSRESLWDKIIRLDSLQPGSILRLGCCCF